MKRLFALLLALTLIFCAFAEEEDENIIRLQTDPPTYLQFNETTREWDLYNETGKIDTNYHIYYYGQEESAYLVRHKDKYGYLSLDGRWIFEPQFDDAYDFMDNGLAVVKVGDKLGLVTLDGEYLFEPQFDPVPEWAYDLEFSEGIAASYKDGLYGYITEDGRVLFEPQFIYANDFCEGFAVVKVEAEPPFGEMGENNKVINLYGYVTKDGEWLIEPSFEYAYDFSEGAAIVKMDGLYGLIGKDGQYIIEPRYMEMKRLDDETMFAVREDGKKWGLVNIQGDQVTELKFAAYRYSGEELYAVTEDGLKWGFIDRQGTYVIEPKYAECKSFSEGLCAVREDGVKWGFIDKQGNWVIEPKYVKCYYNGFTHGNGLAIVSHTQSGFDILIDKAGNELLEDSKISLTNDGLVYAATADNKRYYRITGNGLQEVTIVNNDMYLVDYYPFEGEKVAELDYEADFAFDGKNPVPRLDGATALLPVYAALAQAVYPEDTRYENYYDYSSRFAGSDVLFTCTKTNKAYDRLVDGEADIIFCAGPSDQQIKDAKARGVEFEYTLFGYESFVFIVNPENPLDGVTVDQIKAIYSGELTTWDELGVEGLGDIIAYQRPKNSGSQTALEKLMGDTPIMEAPQMYVSDGMEDILQTIEYRNLPNAIGYTFRFFCADMVGSKVKLLAIDGIEPTVENISNGKYPIITPLYAVTRKGESNPNVKRLLDFLTDLQGQELVEKSGYVGLGN